MRRPTQLSYAYGDLGVCDSRTCGRLALIDLDLAICVCKVHTLFGRGGRE